MLKYDEIEAQFICLDECDAYEYGFNYLVKVKEQTQFCNYEIENRRVDFPYGHGRCGQFRDSDNRLVCLTGDSHLLAFFYLSRTDSNNWQCNICDCSFIEINNKWN